MKLIMTTSYRLAIMLLASFILFSSCDKEDDLTIENKQVTGTMNYTTTSVVPLTFDSTGLIPLTARIGQSGTGTISDIGEVHMVAEFIFDFTTGTGTGFTTTYTGTNPASSFMVNGNSQVQLDGTIDVNENIISGTGKFSKIKGGGVTIVQLNAQQTAGTGEIDWTVTF